MTFAETGLFIFLYNYTYNHTVKDATANIKCAASTVAKAFEIYNPNNPEDYKNSSDFLKDMCDGLNITYLYVMKPDLKNKDEIYMATGWGDKASEEFKNNRYTGYVAKGKLKDEQIRAYYGEKEVTLHEKNRYDDTLICYTPVTRYFDFDKLEYVDKTVTIACAEVSLSKILSDFNSRYINLVIIILIVTILLFAVTGLILYFKVSKPLRFISKRMKSFVSQKDAFFEKLPVKGKDEIAEMSDSFNTMAEEIDRFIFDLSELNRQKAELNIARTIQRGLLDPQSYKNNDVLIKASMLTAKDVGGDLYDYHVLDNNNVFVAIADVSGKGVTAALFMSRAITMLNEYAKLGYSPGKMLYEYNNSLVKHNPEKMFITTFVAVYNPETKILTYANAGHNPPYIVSDKLKILNEKSGVASGVFKNAQYREFQVKMNSGDCLFMFTDGVTEAQNKDGELLGEERLERVLFSGKNRGAQKLVNAVHKEIKTFAEKTVQSDDITMLALEITTESAQNTDKDN